MRFKELKYLYNANEDIKIFSTETNKEGYDSIDIEEYLRYWIGGDEEAFKISFQFDFDDVYVELEDIIELLINDMYDDDPIYLTDDFAKRIVKLSSENKYRDVHDLIFEKVNKRALDFIQGEMLESIASTLKAYTIEDIVWE